ncbi:Aga2 [Kluyveromyces lactis]|nr:Aga2 [Kluyveromyces lactis]
MHKPTLYISLTILTLSIFANTQSVSTYFSTSCETIPEPFLETTPISTRTRTMTSNGETFIGITEVYQSITYVSDCVTDDYDEYTSTLVIW